MKRREPAPAGAATLLERGRAALGRRAWSEAYEAFGAAAAGTEAEALGVADLEAFALAAAMVGLVDEQLRLLERVYEAGLRRGEELAAARGAFWLGMRLFSVGEPARGSAWMARAHRLVEGKDCAERGYLLLPAMRRLEAAGDVAGAAAAVAEAEALGDRFGDADLSAFARSFHGRLLLRQGRVEEGLALLDEAMLAATSGGLSPVVTGLTYCACIAACHQIFALDRGREWTAALAAWCEAQPQLATFTGQCRVHRSELLVLGGAWPDAIVEAEHVARTVRSPDPGAVGDAHYQRAEIHRLRGEADEAERAYRAASERGREPHPGLALVWLASGRGDAAASAVRRLLGALTEPLARAQLLPAAIEIMLATGAGEEAAAACHDLEAIAARFGTDVLGAMAAHARGAVELAAGRAAAAVEPLRRSLGIWQRLAAPYLAARVRALLAQTCQALGDEETAHLERALAREVFERLGAAPDVRAVDEAGGAPAAEVPGRLTTRELQVLRLVATGKTNKAIARELFVSEKTVDRHVSNIFTKLDVGSRAAATAYAYEHRLL